MATRDYHIQNIQLNTYFMSLSQRREVSFRVNKMPECTLKALLRYTLHTIKPNHFNSTIQCFLKYIQRDVQSLPQS